MVSVPSGWKLQETEVDAPVVLADVNLHVSFPCVPFATKISFGVCTSKADVPAVTAERETRGVKSRVQPERHAHVSQRRCRRRGAGSARIPQ